MSKAVSPSVADLLARQLYVQRETARAGQRALLPHEVQVAYRVALADVAVVLRPLWAPQPGEGAGIVDAQDVADTLAAALSWALVASLERVRIGSRRTDNPTLALIAVRKLGDDNPAKLLEEWMLIGYVPSIDTVIGYALGILDPFRLGLADLLAAYEKHTEDTVQTWLRALPVSVD